MGRFVEKLETAHTGGGCMLDLLHLVDGRVLGVNDECVVLYPSYDAYQHGDADGNFDFPLVERAPLPDVVALPRAAAFIDDWQAREDADVFALATGESLVVTAQELRISLDADPASAQVLSLRPVR